MPEKTRGMSCYPDALDAHPTVTVEVAMNRSILILLWAFPMCFLASSAAEARLLQNAKADFCIGVDHASTSPGASIKQFRCDGKPNQQWNTKKAEPGFFSLENEKSGKCMGVDHASKQPGADIKQFDCDGSENQKWTVKACPGGGECMVNKKSGLCLAADRLGHDVQLEQHTCGGGSTQVWTGF
jgi:ricin-type beta-trefoil lectin protein